MFPVIRKMASHYVIDNYELGYSPRLEKAVSVWNEVTHSYDSMYRYDAEEQKLYLPRGLCEAKLCSFLEDRSVTHLSGDKSRRISFNMVYKPRNEQQKEAIQFLTAAKRYSHLENETQFLLSLPSGGGKTFCTVAAACAMNRATLIIVHSDDIRQQWVSRILEYTDVPEEYIVSLTSSTQMEKYLARPTALKLKKEFFYIITHSLLRSFLRNHTPEELYAVINNMGVGIKVIDEAHKEFYNTILIDNITNVNKNIYLSATFGRNNRVEDTVYKRFFEQTAKLFMTDEDMNHEKNVVYITQKITTRANQLEIVNMRVMGAGGFNKFSVNKYTDYAMRKGVAPNAVITWLYYLIQKGVKGTILIMSAKIDSCNYFLETISKLFPDKKCAVHTSQSKCENIEEYDIIMATSKKIGTGNDISTLSAIINMEPIGSKDNNYQVFHRLMRGNNSDIKYYIDIVDTSVPNVRDMFKRNSPNLEKYACKHTVVEKFVDITPTIQ